MASALSTLTQFI